MVGLTVVVLLNSVSGVVAVLGIQVRDVHHNNLRRVWPLFYLIYVRLHISYQLLVLLIVEFILVEDDDAEFLGVGSQANKRFQRGKELKVTVGSNSNENLVILRNRMLWKFFFDYLGKVDLHGEVVPFECRHYLMEDSFALEEDGPTHSRDNIHYAIGALSLIVKAQTSHFGRG